MSRSSCIALACRTYLNNLEAKKLLPVLNEAIINAAKGKELSDEEKRNIDAFSLLSELAQQS